jgi:hypothetical protein
MATGVVHCEWCDGFFSPFFVSSTTIRDVGFLASDDLIRLCLVQLQLLILSDSVSDSPVK